MFKFPGGKTVGGIEFLILLTCWSLSGGNSPLSGRSAPQPESPASPSKIAQFVRDRFEVPESVGIRVDPLRRSAVPGFYETVVTSDHGTEKRRNSVYITKDGRCFVAGNVFALFNGSSQEIIRCVREAAKVPSTTKLTLEAFQKSIYSGFLRATISAVEGKNTQVGEVYITTDRRAGVLGMVLPFSESYIERMIVTRDQPSVGPANAPVTIVEYADLQCATCARFHEFLERELLPRFQGKIRLIFKELPLPRHDWSFAAAVGNECVFQVEPSAFLRFRTLLFAAQGEITVANVRERMLAFGQGLGIAPGSLARCVDSRASSGRVEADRKEAEALRVNKTPTCFVNGRIVIGAPHAEVFFKIIDEALISSQKGWREKATPNN